MTREPQDTSAEEPDGGNLQVRFRGGPGRGDRPGLLNNVLECLRRLEQQNTHETARRVLRYCSQTLRYAIITGRAETDALGGLRGALAPRNTRHRASIKTPKEVGALLRAIHGYNGRLITKFALRFAPVFPGERVVDRPMSNNTLNAALRRLGYGHDDMTAHGFRSMASTLLNELGWSADAIERQLAHGERDGVRCPIPREASAPTTCKLG